MLLKGIRYDEGTDPTQSYPLLLHIVYYIGLAKCY